MNSKSKELVSTNSRAVTTLEAAAEDETKVEGEKHSQDTKYSRNRLRKEMKNLKGTKLQEVEKQSNQSKSTTWKPKSKRSLLSLHEYDAFSSSLCRYVPATFSSAFFSTSTFLTTNPRLPSFQTPHRHPPPLLCFPLTYLF